MTERVSLRSKKYCRASRVFAFLRLLRITGIRDFFLHYVIIIVVLAAIIASISFQEIDGKLPILLAFSISSALFSCVINDLYDAELDELDPETRNPLARGEISRRTVASIVLMLLATSAFLLALLPSRSAPWGVVGLVLSFTYSYGIRAKMRPFLDVAYHGILFAFPFIMGYTLYKPFDKICLLVSIAIGIGGTVSELLQEVRDYDFDKAFGKTTAVLLGKKKSLALGLGLIIIWIPIVVIASGSLFFFPLTLFFFRVPFQFLVLPPLSLFVLEPIFRGIMVEAHQTVVYDGFKKRALVVFIILVSSSAAVFAYSSTRYYYGDLDWENYVVRLDARTLIAGPESWSVAFVRFRYRDEANHYYLLLYKNGILELTKVVSSEKTFLNFVETDLSPFDWHSFEIILEGPSIRVLVDGVLYVDIKDDSSSKGVVCLSGICSARLAFFKGVEVYPSSSTL